MSLSINLKKIFKPLLLSLVISTTVFAATPNKIKLVDEVITTTGLEKQFAELGPIAEESMNQAFMLNDKLTDLQKAKLKTVVMNSFESTFFIQKLNEAISENLDAKALENLIAIYKRPSIKKITQAELEAGRADGMQERAMFLSNMVKNPPTTARLKLVKRLDKATQASDMTTKLMLNTFASMVKVFSELDPQLNTENLKEKVDIYQGTLQQIVQNQISMMFLYTYKNISDKELEEYITLHETNPNVQKLNTAALKAIDDGFAAFVKNIAPELATFAKKEDAKKHS